MDNWISVKDRLPKDMEVVQVWSNSSLGSTIAFYFKNDWLYYAINDGCFWISSQPHIKILYWMPRPEPPKDLLND